MAIYATGAAAAFLSPQHQEDGSWALILSALPPATGDFDLTLTETADDESHVTHFTISVGSETGTLADLTLSAEAVSIEAAIGSVAATIGGNPIVLLANPDSGLTDIGTLYGFGEEGMPSQTGPVDVGSVAQQISFTVTGGCYAGIHLAANADNTDAAIWWVLDPEVGGMLAGQGGDFVDGSTRPLYGFTVAGINAGDVVTAILDHSGRSYILVNGVKAEGSEVGPLTVDASYTYLSVANGYGNPMEHVTYGPLAQPLAMLSTSLTSDFRPSCAISYYNEDGVAPTGYEMQYEAVVGSTILRPWFDAKVASSTGAGHAVIEGTHALPEAYRGGQVAIRMRQKNKTSATDIRNVDFPSIKRFGMNVQDTVYFAYKDAPFRDWQRRMCWHITGGTYDGISGNDLQAGMERLLAGNVVDHHGHLLEWPEDATLVRLGTIDTPDISEQGDRLLVVPAGNVITIDLLAGGSPADEGITINTAHPQHDPAAGHYVINFAPGSSYSNRWLLKFDPDHFVPGPVSFKKVGDTSDYMLTDEYVAALSNFQVIRLMDMMDANHGGRWDRFDGRLNWGWSIEAMVELFNRTLAIPYFSYGYNTTPAVAAQFMEYFEENVDPSIPYFLADPSNEVWGGIPTLTDRFAYQSVLSGRGTDDGYGAPIPAENVYNPQGAGTTVDGIATHYEAGIGLPLGRSITEGHYVFAYISGGPDAGLFQAKRTTATTAALPTNSGGITDNDDFHYIGDLRPGAMREYGAYGYALQTAISAVSPRLKMLINMQASDSVGAEFSSARTALDFATTENGTDTWGSIVDGAAIAPYVVWDHAPMEEAEAGEERVQAFHDAFAAAAPGSLAWTAASFAGISAYFATKSRNKAPMLAAYECGMEGVTWSSPPTGLVDDFRTYLNSDGCVTQLEGYYDDLFAAGCTVACAFNFGPGTIAGATSIPYGYYNHFESVSDTTSGRARADIATGAKYKALAS